MPYKTVYDVTVKLPGKAPSSGLGSRSAAPTAQREVTITDAPSPAAAVSQALDRVQQTLMEVSVKPRETWVNPR